jgi:hypothetical protein
MYCFRWAKALLFAMVVASEQVFAREITVSKMSVTRQSGEVTFGTTLATVEPVWTIFRSLSNIMWKGKTRQNVAAFTLGSEKNRGSLPED